MGREYSNEELNLIEKNTTELCAYLFVTKDKRNAIYQSLKFFYEEMLELKSGGK